MPDRGRAWRTLVVTLAMAALVAGATGAQTGPSGLPQQLLEVGLEQKIGAKVPAALAFTAHDGSAVRMDELLGERPLLLVPVYYDCPMLCTMILEGLVRSLRAVPLEPGVDFEVVAVSFDAGETPEQAAARREAALAAYGRPGAESGMHFLTGDPESLAALMDAVGFRYRYNEETGEFAHVAALIVLTPEGTVARYFPGVEYPPRDLRLSMVEASDNRIGTAFDSVLLYCFRYDPTTGRYTAATMNLIRAGGLLTLLALGGFIAVSLRRDKARNRTAEARA